MTFLSLKKLEVFILQNDSGLKQAYSILTLKYCYLLCQKMNRYSLLIDIGDKKNPIQTKRINQKGRIAQSYPRQLLNRLIKYRDWVLAFLYNLLVPFTNNQAERDIRMFKVHETTAVYDPIY